MKRYLTLTSWLAVALLGSVALGSVAVRLSFEQLVQQSDRVVVARVQKCESAWGPEHRLIHTTCSFDVEQEVAGAGAKRFQIVQPGGAVGRLAQRTHGYPTFREGQAGLLLFLHRSEHGFRVVGLSQGVFFLHRDAGRQLAIQRLEGLDFLKDDGRPLILTAAEAFARIRALWKDRVLER
ncbi:MAG: hypothetical protein JXR96_01055 [Deltaproteobacteria bacterium]|nr:hypothetical protein [Deltaproteobacteria bacterium]